MTEGTLKYGAVTNSSMDLARANFPLSPIMMQSYCTTPIELLSNDGKDTVVGTATGFFWVKDGKPYLVTNYHVISGLNPLTGKSMHKELYVPNKINYYGTSITHEGKDIIFSRHKWSLEFKDAIDIAKVLKTPPKILESITDIWAVPIAPHTIFLADPNRTGFDSASSATCAINQCTSEIPGLKAGDDCYVLGYPLRNYSGVMPPQWKRGSIASETCYGLDGHPAFLIDAATTKSMSGSPIIATKKSILRDPKTGQLGERTNRALIGVYGGRLQRRDMEATQTGYGWYKTMIDPVIDFYNFNEKSLITT